MRTSRKTGSKPNLFMRLYHRFDAGFERMRAAYIVILSSVLVRRGMFGSIFLGFCVVSMGLVFVLGEDFFPTVDAGDIRLHMRAPTGTRIEETARLADEVEKVVRQVVPGKELDTILDNLGLPYSGINLSYSNAGTIGTLDGEIQMALNEDHKPTQRYIDKLRALLPQRFPGVEFFFQPADIVTQILNFGLPAAIDVQIVGNDQQGNFDVARKLIKQMRLIPGTVDTHIQQKLDEPVINLQMDRTRLQQLNLNANNVAQNVLISLSGSSQTAPSFWFNNQNGVEYSVAVQTPQYDISSIDQLLRTPVSASGQRSDATARQPGAGVAAEPVCRRHALQHPAGDRPVCERGRPRPRQRGDAGEQAGRSGPRNVAAWQPDRGARPGADHAHLVLRSGRGRRDGDRAGVPADRRELPVVG